MFFNVLVSADKQSKIITFDTIMAGQKKVKEWECECKKYMHLQIVEQFYWILTVIYLISSSSVWLMSINYFPY